ncbi:MAG: hypothetical protein HCAMLNBO_02631 [Candidatus Brocadia fulgida]|nr:hypothetical protein [Candidatus Brocadia fulgida]
MGKIYSTVSQFVIYSSSTRTNRVCPCHPIINLKFIFYEHLEYNLRTAKRKKIDREETLDLVFKDSPLNMDLGVS